MEQMQREVLQAVPDLKVTVDAVVTTPTDCIVRWTFCGTAGAPGVPHESCAVHYHGSTWFRVEDGKIVEGWDYWDKTAFVQDLQKVTSIPETLVA
jgi:predicted ester cyclase